MCHFSKKFLVLLLSSVLSGSPVFAVTCPTIDVPYTANTIMVDGNNADWARIKSKGKGISFYKGDGHNGTPTNLGTTICGQINNEADCRVDLWLAHDSNYLYVLAEVKDDNYEPFDANNLNNMAYLEDTLHLYIDSTNSRMANIPYPPINTQAGYEQFGISTDKNIWAENIDFTTSTITPAPQGSYPDGIYWVVQCKARQLVNGYLYTFEERIALSGRPGKNMAPLVVGNSYGFDAEFCDADNGVQLQGYIWWSSDGSKDAWNYENLWGTMTLMTLKIPADINGDNNIDFIDFALFAEQWLETNCNDCNGADLNGDGTVGFDDLWQFAENWLKTTSLPDPAINPNPADGATKVSTNVVLNWTPGARATSHDIYFGTQSPGSFQRNQMETTFAPGTLLSGKTYYWRIDEVNFYGKTTGTVWSFKTGGKIVCFPGDTLVWVDGALVQISTVSPNKSFGRLCDNTQTLFSKEIEKFEEHQGAFDCYDIILENGASISVADNHYFLLNSDQWVSVRELTCGLILQSLNGPIGIKYVVKRAMPLFGKVYNLKIKDSDRYFVGKDGVVVRDY